MKVIRVIVLALLVFAHIVFWFGVLYDAVSNHPASRVAYSDAISFATLWTNVKHLRARDIGAALPPFATGLLAIGTALTISALLIRNRRRLKTRLLAAQAIILSPTALIGLVSMVAIVANRFAGRLDGEAVSEGWFFNAAVAVLFIATVMLGAKEMIHTGSSLKR